MNLPYGEEVNYWKTSQTSPDVWIRKTRDLIMGLGGYVVSEAFGSEPMAGRAAFMMEFEIDGSRFRVIWPVLPTRKKIDERAAMIQAVTLMYHDIKSKCLNSVIFGAKVAFFSYLLLPNGNVAPQASIPDLMRGVPLFMDPQLGPGQKE